MTALEALNTPHAARLTVRDFLVLADSGAFRNYAKTELIEGEIICVNAQFSRHAMAKTDLAVALAGVLRAIASPLRVTVEVAVELDERNLAEPDLVVTSYRGEGPVPRDTVVLAIEVSDTSLDHDLVRKAVLYAAAGIAEYWVADLNARVIHQMWVPVDEAYAQRREIALGEQVAAVAIAGLAVETKGLGW